MYTRNNCDYTFREFPNTIIPAFHCVTVDNIRKYFRKSRDYAHAYRQGHTGLEADVAVKEYKSHRRVSELESRQ